ncbi:TIGR01457 family HAD-type hydrolase [Lactobacillus sp. Sy-1]|uniref:TIGR01457 family HAD-type hydrolase n=1 Tax=Lactobacillus sp. Sy-1 TaxID=2109645 RepID=UPI001C59CDA8|nr:TIGR01457 family HAD-type hydrolase [Lactobacillus sp. Sy-1]MBW1605755.1 TIGR01457 family HAD-type hydrolase [Lactobacillus sp. Sy-1]
MKRYQGYFIDLDGTIYAGKKRIPAAKRFIERLQKAEIPFLFVTNNTTKLPKDVVANLADNHDIHVQESNVYTAGLATADFMNGDADEDHRKAYVIGEAGLVDALEARGFEITADNPDYVVVGLDTAVTYEKFCVATLAIQHGAKFIGTNPDTNIPNERGMLPGAGSLVDLVRYATQTNPVLIGKPKAIILENALRIIGLQKDQVIMVGDNYMTDISAGINFGIDTLLVYTGVSTKQQIATKTVKPTWEIDSLDEWQLGND